jgi:hypothetical protein
MGYGLDASRKTKGEKIMEVYEIHLLAGFALCFVLWWIGGRP